ncbi:MAG: malate dehydrogenase (quinone) [Bacillota bacterium]
MSKQTCTDVILIGAGIMSATLGALLQELAPGRKITVFEKLNQAGEESSNEWNNAGTGHASLCELNYTVEQADGTINIDKALDINEQFLASKQFWSYLVNNGLLRDPANFIKPLPHLSLVQGEQDVTFLRKRFTAMSESPLFQGMEFCDDSKSLQKWFPLIMKNRLNTEPMAATKSDSGTDINFGALTRAIFDFLQKKNVNLKLNHQVESLKRTNDGCWELKVRNVENGKIGYHSARFVFIGAGGGSLHLLQKSGAPEGKRIGGFPVSGLFLVCNNPAVIAQHHAKVYGKAKIGAPPMSVPHLDTRFIEGKKTLLFGPFAGFSPKFLKQGSVFDLITSIKPNNLLTMMAAGLKNASLTKYLIEQVMLSKEQRLQELREFVPGAQDRDWEIIIAGQRVQVIKDTAHGGKGTLLFGTEVISTADGSLAALLGASPGASIAVSAMLDLLKKCFFKDFKAWEPKIREMIPSYSLSLRKNPDLFHQINAETVRTLGLNAPNNSKW